MSPVTSLAVLPKILQFSTAGSDCNIRVYRSNLVDDNTCQILNGHLDFINDLSYDCETNYLASCSDDQTARIWDTNSGTCITTFYLQSSGTIYFIFLLIISKYEVFLRNGGMLAYRRLCKVDGM